MFKASNKVSCQSGRTMIEMLIVLAVLAMVSIGGLLFFRDAMDTYNATKVAEDVQLALRAHSEKMFLGAPSDTVAVECTKYIQENSALESCFCQQSSIDGDSTKPNKRKVTLCNFVVTTQGIADVLIKRLKIARINGGTKSFCVHSAVGGTANGSKNKWDYSNSANKDRRSFGWKNCACQGSGLECAL